MVKKQWWNKGRSLCLIFLLAVPFLYAQQKKGTGTLEVLVTDCHSAKGNLLISLFNNEKGFPSNPLSSYQQLVVKATAGTIKIKWDNIPEDVYAIAVLHDENGDGQLNTNFLGIPTEGFGFSNNKLGIAGPPSFQRASFTHQSKGTVMRIQLRND
jgi:uncharacterized protein (DUF2141 family)